MFYPLLKTYARLALKIFCRKIIINQPSLLHKKGPLLLAANHPNSFLDGIILTTLFDQKLFALARGDAFQNKKIAKLLRWMNLLPVYRHSEGAENLNQNYTTFQDCHTALGDKHIVLIFSEGGCKNEWHLRPLKKGTARLALGSWQKGIDVPVIPVGLNYNPFGFFGKNVVLNFGEPLNKTSILHQPTEGKQLAAFNEQLQQQLHQLVYEIDPHDKRKIEDLLYVPQPATKRVLLSIPALFGWIVHAPIYYPVKIIAGKLEKEHFDAVVVSLLFLLYPIYALLLFAIVSATLSYVAAFLMLLLLPFSAWACVQLKSQM